MKFTTTNISGSADAATKIPAESTTEKGYLTPAEILAISGMIGTGAGQVPVTGDYNPTPTVASAPTSAARGTGTLTLASPAANGKIVTIGDRVYTFVTALSSPVVAGEIVTDGYSAPTDIARLITAIGGVATATATHSATPIHADVTAVAGTTNRKMDVTSNIYTTAGNIASTTNIVDATWTAATLTGGTAGTAASVIGQRIFVGSAPGLYITYECKRVTPVLWIALTSNNSVFVNPTGSDTERGIALLASYTAAKTLTPNGSALSASNRAQVVIPSGNYRLAESLVLDTKFIDLIAQVPTKPSKRLAADIDGTPDEATVNLAGFRPQSTLIYCDVDFVSTIIQTANDVQMFGFSVAQLCVGVGFFSENKYLDALNWGALLIGNGCANAPSVYTDMYFWTTCATDGTCGGVRAYTNFSGNWYSCISNSCSFRNGYGDQGTPSAEFTANMYDCQAGPFSFIGDYFVGRKANYTAKNCRLERCSVLGHSMDGATGIAGFAGGHYSACAVESTCVFVECEAGSKSFGVGNTSAGTFIRCRGGSLSFGATVASGDEAIFSGYAEDCIARANSFGGTAIAGYGKCTGTLVRCIGEGNTKSMRLDGATIRDSRITTTTTGIHTVTLLDSDSIISNSDILVLQGGTGVPVYAGSALNAAVYHCRMNNATNDADGLHANVTNTVATPGNVIGNTVR